MKDHSPSRVLIVAGSAEARLLARQIPSARVHLCDAERSARIWLQGATRGPVTAPWLAAQRVTAVIEAAHPCDGATARCVAMAAQAVGLPHLQLVRPGWRATRRDRWVPLRDVAAAGSAMPTGARVFATVGRAELAGLRAFRGTVLARMIGAECGPFPLPRGRFVPGEGPFSVADEIRLLRALRIDWLVLRNAGGAGGWPKLAAARHLGLRVAMIDRPARPRGARVETVKEALAWLQTRQILAE